jgi:ABC-2 type transport system ATP-binding protein
VTATEFVTHMARMSGLPAVAAKERAAESLRHVGLHEERYRQVGTYSTGMKQRVKLAQALAGDPRLLLLDEPTNGLDPAGTKEIRDLIPRLAHESRAIMLCSHLLHEVELVCQNVAIIKQGVVIANAPIKELLSQGNELQIKVDKMEEAIAILNALPWVKSVKSEDEYLVIDVPRERSADINLTLAQKGILVSELVNRSASLESVFLQLTGGESGD